MVLWQGKDGEPGLDVSNVHNKHLPTLTESDGLLQEQPECLFFCAQSMHRTYITVRVDSNMKYTSTCMRYT